MVRMVAGAALAEWRREQKLSQAQAAELVDVSQATWAAWELERKSPDLGNGVKLEQLTKGRIRVSDWPTRADRRAKRERARRRHAS